jgi:hypothetical protein
MDWDCNALAKEYTNLNGSEQAAIWRELAQEQTADSVDQNQDGVVLKTGRLLLRFRIGDAPGLSLLADRLNPRIWADAPYAWHLSLSDQKAPDRVILSQQPIGVTLDIQEQGIEGWRILCRGRMLNCLIEIVYHVSIDGLCLDEQISIKNDSDQPICLLDWNFGLARKLGYTWGHSQGSDLRTFRAFAIPWYRTIPCYPEAIQDFDLDKLRYTRGAAGMTSPSTNGHPSEAWGLSQDQCGLLVIKYAPEHIEYSVLRSETRACTPQLYAPAWVAAERRSEHLIFGGSMRCHEDPSPDLLQPGEQFELGLTRYQLFDGSRENGFAIFRKFMEDRGCGVRAGYDPPLHWNELYDNPFDFFEKDSEVYQAEQKKYYSLSNMLQEAEKAKRHHCDALYLDPGWDTAFASSVWNDQLLGNLADFVRQLQETYGLRVALHTPLAGWCDSSTYPETAQLMDLKGERHKGHLCSGSRAYLDEKANRLRILAENGITFLMFDGTFYTGPCYDPGHGHAIPYTRDAHVRSYRWLARQIHAVNPDLSIEMHDFVVSGVSDPYCPVYLGYGPDGFDEVWGWELMWDPMSDLTSGKALALYYFNLAYSVPVYLHIDLKKDNINCLMFWWFASTCRHLGIGGTHPDPDVRERLISALELYKRYKHYYARGTFTGVTEQVHLHTLAGQPGGVLNLFNLNQDEKTVQCDLAAADLNLAPGTLLVGDRDCSLEWIGAKLRVACRIPAMGAKVVVI